jgi:DNA polymerase III delta prime subunit
LVDIDLKQHAETIPQKTREEYILSFKEEQLYPHLKIMVERMLPGSLVEITRGNTEYGRDLVVKKIDELGSEYIGVVVKRGDSSGKITGKEDDAVRELIDQVKEAYANPVFLRSIGAGQVTLNNVWIIFVGTLTDGASHRLEFELMRSYPLRIFPIAWVVQELTKHYPEFFFQGEIAKFLQDRIKLLETRRSFVNAEVTLSSSWVDPWVKEYKQPQHVDEQIKNILKSNKLPFTKLESLIKPGRYIVLVGDPGTGKSTALAKIALDNLSESFKNVLGFENRGKVKIPILVKAREFLEFANLGEMIDCYVPKTINRADFEISTIMIDGLDELSVEKGNQILKKAKEYSTELNCGLVISSRKIEAFINPLLPFERFEILPMEFQQAMKLVGLITKDKDIFKIIEEGLRNEDLKLSLTPLALELLIKIATAEKEIPASAAEVFDQYTDISLGRYDKANNIESIFEYYTKKGFIAELAWNEFFLKNRLQITKQELDEFVDLYFKEHAFDVAKFSKFKEEIEKAGIIRFGEVVFFRHRSFLDYFVALRLTQHLEENFGIDDNLVSAYYSDIWKEVTFFFIGIRRKITKGLVEKLFGYKKDGLVNSILKLLIGKLIQAGWYTESNIKKSAIIESIRYASDVRRRIQKILKESNEEIPKIFSDIFTFIFAEYSFSSRTMRNEVAQAADYMLEMNDSDCIINGLILLQAGNRILGDAEREALSKKALKALSTAEISGKLTIDDKVVGIFLLDMIERQKDTPALKSIKRKMRDMRNMYPDEVRRFLGPEYAPKSLPDRKKRDNRELKQIANQR